MPDFRFAIGAVLACALLIVAAFGLAATVQVAHRRSAAADDPWRTLAFPDPTDWGLLADRSRPAPMAKSEVPEMLQASAAVPALGVEATGSIKSSDRVPQEVMPQDVMPQDVVPQEGIPQDTVPQDTAPQVVVASQDVKDIAEQPTLDPPLATIVPPSAAPSARAAAAPEGEPELVVGAIPGTKAAVVQPVETPPTVEGPADDDWPLEPSERVGTLPAFPTAGHGFVPPEHPIALPVPLPPSKPAIKKPPKKKVARSRPHWLSAPPPFANTGYPPFGSDKFGSDKFGPDRFGPDTKTGPDKTTGYDRKWTVQ